MPCNIRIIGMFMLALCTPACGSPSQATLDCTEFSLLAVQLRSLAEAPASVIELDTCEAWLEATSTRCQGAFRALALCSRLYQSAPSIRQGECVSELVELNYSCVLPDAFHLS